MVCVINEGKMIRSFMREGIIMDQNKTGKFIAKLRKGKNMTQEQLAEKMGVSINAVSKWERGLSFPDVSLYKKLCEVLDTSIEEIINGEKDSSEDAKTKAIINTVKSTEKTKKELHLVALISIIMIIILVIVSIFIYQRGKDKLSDYYERNYQKTLVARDVEALIKYRNDGEFPDYYGGVYISDDAYHLIVLIVKDKIPSKDSMEYYYYNELFTIDESIKIEYVKNSYHDLEKVFNIINDYLTNNEIPKDFNSVGIDVIKNKVIVNYVEVDEKVKKEFKEKIIDSDLVEFEQGIDYVDDKNKCMDYPDDLGTSRLENSGKLLISVRVGNKQFVPVELNVYDDGTYELFTTYQSCKPGAICTSMLNYLKSVKGTYDYDITKIIEASTNANDKTYSMDNLPKYEISLGEEYIEKYDTLTFTVEKGKKNRYLEEFLKSINVDLSKCAKGEYTD